MNELAFPMHVFLLSSQNIHSAHCVFFKGTVSPDTGLYSRFWKSKSVLSVGRHMVSAFFKFAINDIL
jgi:hypothetical protein